MYKVHGHELDITLERDVLDGETVLPVATHALEQEGVFLNSDVLGIVSLPLALDSRSGPHNFSSSNPCGPRHLQS